MPHLTRREMLRLFGSAGLALSAGPRLLPSAHAAAGYAGPLLVTVHASGGWDPTLLCDPKGRASESEPDPVNRYDVGDIEEIGPFRVAPVDGHAAFFERMRHDLLVLNGVDAQTNSHDTGTRHMWSGSMEAGYPALAALQAAQVSPRPSLAYISHGGFDLTEGLVASTRLPDGSTIQDLSHPTRLSSSDPDRTLFAPSIHARLARARQERLARQAAAAELPRVSRAMSLLRDARVGDNELARLAEVLPADLSSHSGLSRQAALTMAAFKAGVSVSTNLVTGGFDTHGNHDASHIPRLQHLIAGLQTLVDEAERYDLVDRLVVVVGSDFARTPWYNAGNGKDHWTITSLMMWGPGIQGGRVIGQTDERQIATPLDLSTLRPSPSGGRITYRHVHASLRELLGLRGAPVAARYDVGSPLPLFT